MDDAAAPPDPIDGGVESSRRRLREWPAWQQHLYAALVTVGWLGIVVAVVFIVIILGTAEMPSAVSYVLLSWVAVFGLVVMSWLFWNMALPLYADLATRGRFSAWRRERLRRFDTWFSRLALVLLGSVVLIPLLQLLE